MKANKILRTITLLEERLKAASPPEAAKLTKKLVSLKDEWINQ